MDLCTLIAYLFFVIVHIIYTVKACDYLISRDISMGVGDHFEITAMQAVVLAMRPGHARQEHQVAKSAKTLLICFISARAAG
jgi:hypothetical protein